MQIIIQILCEQGNTSAAYSLKVHYFSNISTPEKSLLLPRSKILMQKRNASTAYDHVSRYYSNIHRADWEIPLPQKIVEKISSQYFH